VRNKSTASSTSTLRVVALTVIAVVLGSASAAQGAFPGSNGKLAFSTTDVFSIEPDGSGKTTLADTTDPETQPAWSPNGSRIAYTRGGGTASTIWLMNADGSNQTSLSTPLEEYRDFDPAWSPDGLQVVFTRRTIDQSAPDRLVIVDVNTQGEQSLTEGMQASWSPNGTLIAFAGSCGTAQDICVIQPDGSGLDQVIATTGEAGDPNWAPDASKLAYWEGQSTYTVNVNGTGDTLIGTGIAPAWSPDGTKIATICATVAVCPGGTVVRILNADGSGTPATVPNTAGALYVDWQSLGAPAAPPADFDGDGDTDFSVWRPSSGVWYVFGGLTQQWGASEDVPVPGQFDADAATDVAVWRPSNGFWYVFGGAAQQWGASTDVPVPGDYDGDGDTEFAVWRPSNGFWYVSGGATQQWGMSGDVPVPADYDGDGDTDIAVWRPSNGFWYVFDGLSQQWGASEDVPVPGQYDADPATDIAVWRPSNGFWYVLGGVSQQWGAPTDIPVAGDYDGDGDTEFAVWRPSTGFWYVFGGATQQWGMSGDKPLPPLPSVSRVLFP
jgi:hypothetical protein